jgi:hypothetical protein
VNLHSVGMPATPLMHVDRETTPGLRFLPIAPAAGGHHGFRTSASPS